MTGFPGTLHFVCGRLAAGKTTLAQHIAVNENAVLVCEDVWLSKLSDGIRTFDDYLLWSRRCRSVMGPLIIDILRRRTSVVLDFAGNTKAERLWVRSLFEAASAPHVLHFLDVSEKECLARLNTRNKTKAEGLYFAPTTEAEFRAVCQYFQAPLKEEGFELQTVSNKRPSKRPFRRLQPQMSAQES